LNTLGFYPPNRDREHSGRLKKGRPRPWEGNTEATNRKIKTDGCKEEEWEKGEAKEKYPTMPVDRLTWENFARGDFVPDNGVYIK